MNNNKKIIINQEGLVIFEVPFILKTKAMLIQIKHYQLKNILIKLDQN